MSILFSRRARFSLNTAAVLAAAAVCVALWTLEPTRATAEEPAPAHLGDKLFIETSSASVLMGKATMTVSPLAHHEGVYSGTYGMQVSPLSFASEKGDLSVTITDDAIRRLMEKRTISFHGEAKNSNGKHRTIDGRATPAAPDHGDVTLTVVSERGKLVFHTTYRFAAGDAR